MTDRLKAIIIFLISFLIFTSVIIYFFKKQSKPETGIKYVAVGDSYTIGLGVGEEDRWPNILTDHLKNEGIEINLVANPAVSGYTVRDAIEFELPAVAEIKPDLVTVLIGANDNFGQKKVEIYREELQKLLDKLQPMMSNRKNIVLITIPDYSVSLAASGYQREELSKFIDGYNQVIKSEGDKRGLKVADIFSISQTMTKDEDYVSDGLHPSAQSYAKWEAVIFPVVRSLFP